MVGKSLNFKSVTSRILSAGGWILHAITRTRFLVLLLISALVVILYRGLSSSASTLEKYYCYGPTKSPMEMTPNEMAAWTSHQNTPVIFNKHEPYEINATTIQRIDLNPIKSSKGAVSNKERILLLTPLRDASYFLQRYFELLTKLTYPHDLIDLGFLVSDTKDETMATLAFEVDRIQSNPDPNIPFRSVAIVEKDFGVMVFETVEERHGFAAQAPRRKAMGKARNYLLSSTLKPDHSWVYWRDVDIAESPPSILEDFVAHDKDVLVPNIWFHRYDKNNDNKDIEGRFDYNSWQESDKSRALLQSLANERDLVLAEGYREYDTGRTYMAQMGDWRNNKDEEIELDGIGGVSILVKADVHRAGVNFPSYPFENQAETEGFAKMAKRAGYSVVGLPNYVVWHVDTDEKSGNIDEGILEH